MSSLEVTKLRDLLKEVVRLRSKARFAKLGLLVTKLRQCNFSDSTAKGIKFHIAYIT